jgi:hypothetical protein
MTRLEQVKTDALGRARVHTGRPAMGSAHVEKGALICFTDNGVFRLLAMPTVWAPRDFASRSQDRVNGWFR